MTVADVSERLRRLRSTIDGVPRPFVHAVEIVAVTKGFGPHVIEQAVAVGCTIVGENYAQELLAKRETIDRLQPVVQFIGSLQTNKVRPLVDLVDVWASLDRASVIGEVARRAPASTVLIQVNSTGEATKSGCPPGDVVRLVGLAQDLGLVVDGLMTVGPTNGDPVRTSDAFRLTRELVDRAGLGTCSMGMSGDLRTAVALGSTQVRIGTALFGARPARAPIDRVRA
jgi:PLP dependent protein